MKVRHQGARSASVSISVPGIVLLFLSSVTVFVGVSGTARAEGWIDLWLTRDQQAQRAFDAGDYLDAAMLYSDSMRAGVSLYRAGEFERAAQTFGRVDTPEAHYNRGNALVIQGMYDAAIAAYDQALAGRPEWAEAVENRALAEIRKARLATTGDDAGGTGGQLAADDFVFDDQPALKTGSGNEQVLEEGADGTMNDERLRELWLRRVQTRPADFLAARFYRQLQIRREDVP
jgi:Ca-activated chloride channel family protein